MTGKGPHSTEFYGSVFEKFPCYEMISEGFSCIKMYDKDQVRILSSHWLTQ